MSREPLTMDWSSAQFGSLELGDKRRTDRAVKVGAALAAYSNGSLPKQMGRIAELKGAYRLLNHPNVTNVTVSWDHWEATRERLRTPGLGTVLFIQDQTELDFGASCPVEGLGFVANTFSRGFEVHSTLGVLPHSLDSKPEVVGLALQTVWTRNHPPRKKTETSSEMVNRRTEYDNWRETLEQIGPAPAESSGTCWVSVGDRASDVFTYMDRAHTLGWKCLVRARFNRRLIQETGDEEERLLYDRVRALPSRFQTHLWLRARPGIPARNVELMVAWTPVSLHPTNRSSSKEPVKMVCLRVWEDPQKAKGKDPLEWILLTSLKLEDVQDALEIIGFYRHRWLIEEYHKCLKTGCRMEERQLSTKPRLLALLGFLSIVAVYLLQLKAPAPDFKPPQELREAVKLITQAPEDLSDPAKLLRRIAMLGGFLGRKGDGSPGWQTLWEGWKRLQDILWGMEIAKAYKNVG